MPFSTPTPTPILTAVSVVAVLHRLSNVTTGGREGRRLGLYGMSVMSLSRSCHRNVIYHCPLFSDLCNECACAAHEHFLPRMFVIEPSTEKGFQLILDYREGSKALNLLSTFALIVVCNCCMLCILCRASCLRCNHSYEMLTARFCSRGHGGGVTWCWGGGGSWYRFPCPVPSQQRTWIPFHINFTSPVIHKCPPRKGTYCVLSNELLPVVNDTYFFKSVSRYCI